MFNFDPIVLARIQFAFTVSFHIIFPAFTIGLASFLATLEWRWLKTGNEYFRDLYKFWIKIFAVAFGMGVVSGVVMSYQFGTNWSIFSDKVANVLGPLLGFEVLTAFFLEASFLGIMLFGWGRVSKRMHFFSTCIVAIGTLISAFWILSANSWMQTPQGFSIASDGRLMPTNWLSIIFNPSFPYRFAHMVTAAYLTTAFVVGGVGAFYLWNKRYIPHGRIMLGMAVMLVTIFAPVQLMIGHEHGKNTMEYQPVKVAAMEGNWDKTDSVPLYLFGWPNQNEEKTQYGITIPGGASWVLTGTTNGKVPTLKSYPKEDRPFVPFVFWSFRVMVGLGVLMIFIGLTSTLQYLRGKLFDTKWLQIAWMLMMPSGFIALLAGWFVTEAGRQPWVAYGILRTATSVSPAIIGPQVAISLLAFVVIYSLVFGAGSYYILKLIAKGISAKDEKEQYYKHGIESAIMEASAIKGEEHV
ncbi:cytochrome ubiquinol oxidase subunit I [Legionella fallonii]|uniref:Cytochrome d ubiquinol oxidase, subunit I n=1 Tax=Legionella fallonii LLAP-10 TaxID=1212491 RepID=A0A098GAL1_9GAMM|nr:cytochrome ubiquinol oxidase subunit I [Legionella fallonii]CEG58520.1 Cytochrome d ubiquinol oxidase, subunit I [Legionella fallonii LLAP-10]